MGLVVDRFDSWFARATGVRSPYDFQRDLATGEHLPDLLAVPTGCGKTAGSVLAWAWRRRGPHEDEVLRDTTPRRLVYCLPMRTLVDQVHDAAVHWLSNLGLLAPTRIDDPKLYRPAWEGDGIPVFRLMGGEQAAEWEAHPEREAVLVGTQDMLLSRALNRGYAMYPCNWPIAFGLVNIDALWVLDEVQLMGVGRTTSVQLQHFHRGPDHLPRRTLWMSATLGAEIPTAEQARRRQPCPAWMRTPEHGASEVEVRGLGSKDRVDLRTILAAPKRIEGGRDDWTAEHAGLPGLLRERAGAGLLVLVMVNQVERARDLFGRIKDGCQAAGPEILLLHSRFRPRDRGATVTRLSTSVPTSGRIVVSTQVLEAGIDLDADILVTELCPWPSLVQRLGRLNRRGRHDGSLIVLDVPTQPPASGWPKKRKEREEAEMEARKKAALPYEWSSLEDARSRLRGLGVDSSIASIERLEKKDPWHLQVEGPVLRRFHLDDVFDTDPDLSGGHLDVSGFVRGTDRDVDVHVLWRSIGAFVEMESPPHPDELCSVPVHRLRELGGFTRAWLLGLQRARRRSAAWREATLGDPAIRPGDTVLLDCGTGGYDEARGWTGRRDDRPTTWIGIADGRRAWVTSVAGSDVVEVLEDLDGRVEGWAARDEDPRSVARRWMTLGVHLDAARREALALAKALVPEHAERVALAAHWHDLGKALERQRADAWVRPFQEMLRSAGTQEASHPVEGALYAKSNRRGGRWHPGDRFRHEVGSTLAYLAREEADDLIAWLIMAHHGKVRMLFEPWDEESMNDAVGVRSGDRIPAEAATLVGASHNLALDPELLLSAHGRPSWQGRAARLLNDHGPEFLAYLEAVLRVADWRAST